MKLIGLSLFLAASMVGTLTASAAQANSENFGHRTPGQHIAVKEFRPAVAPKTQNRRDWGACNQDYSCFYADFNGNKIMFAPPHCGFWDLGARGLNDKLSSCLLYTSPSPRDRQKSRMPSSA